MAWTIALSDADISSVTTAYTMAAGTEGRMSASFTNRSTSATATVSLWVVPSGETRGNEHLKESGTVLGLAGTPQATLERSFVMPAGCVAYVQASTANVSCQVQGDVVDIVEATGVSDGTASISYGVNWSNGILAATSLKKNSDDLISCYIHITAGGAPGGVLATLPSGYRPPKAIYFIGTCVSGSVTYPAVFDISTAGAVSVTIIPSSLGLSPGSGSVAIFTGSFYA